MIRATVSLVALAVMLTGCATIESSSRRAVGTGELQPLSAGWEQHLSVTWETAQDRGRQVVSGYVRNTSPYDLAHIRVLVESVDAAGKVIEQRIGVIPGEARGGSRMYFEVPVTPAPSYRVRVFSYDRLESAGLMS
jgi:hypothetical protein